MSDSPNVSTARRLRHQDQIMAYGKAENVTLNGSGVGTISHGLGTTPDWANVQPASTGQIVAVTSLNATSIEITVQDDAGAAVTADTHDFYWEAR